MLAKSSVVYSQENCPACTIAKNLLLKNGYDVEVRMIGIGTWTKQDVQAAAPGARSVPQVVIDGVLIGGLDALKEYLK